MGSVVAEPPDRLKSISVCNLVRRRETACSSRSSSARRSQSSASLSPDDRRRRRVPSRRTWLVALVRGHTETIDRFPTTGHPPVGVARTREWRTIPAMGDHPGTASRSCRRSSSRRLAVELFNHVWTLLVAAGAHARAGRRDDPCSPCLALSLGPDRSDGEPRARRVAGLEGLHRARPGRAGPLPRAPLPGVRRGSGRRSRRHRGLGSSVRLRGARAGRGSRRQHGGVRALRADGARGGEGIADDEDRDHLLSELGTLPGR